MAVVVDEPQFAKLVHEVAHARSGCSNHLGEYFLTDLCNDWLRPTFIAEICQQQQKPRQPFFGRVEELINQVFLNTVFPCQDMRHKHLRERWFVLKKSLDFMLANSHDRAFAHRNSRRQPLWLPDQTSFSQELICTKQRDHGFLALLGIPP